MWAHVVLAWPVVLGMAVPVAVVRRVKLAALRVKVPALSCEWKCPRCRIHIGIHILREFALPDITLT